MKNEFINRLTEIKKHVNTTLHIFISSKMQNKDEEILKENFNNYLNSLYGLYSFLSEHNENLLSIMKLSITDEYCENDGWHIPQSCLQNPNCDIEKNKRYFKNGDLFPREKNPWIFIGEYFI